MRRITDWNHDGIIEYNLRDGGTALSIFADTQTDRVDRTKTVIQHIIDTEFDGRKVVINEPGCSAGDISGPFAQQGHYVWGCDVSPAAYEATKQRYPAMDVQQIVVQDIEPKTCDILVMCEFLEHIDSPLEFVKSWSEYAECMVISHPVMEDAKDPEEGHVWSYYPNDIVNWFVEADMYCHDLQRWPMGFYPMVLAWGRKR